MAGYHSFSELLGRYPNLHCYRRFGSLSAKTLLYKQAELGHLEAELRLISEADEKDPITRGSDQSWSKLNQDSSVPGVCYQRDKVAEIEEKLKKYRPSPGEDSTRMNEGLIRLAKVHELGRPSDDSLTFLRRWLQSPGHGQEFLVGREADPWEPERERDLLVLYDEGSGDGLARALSKMEALWHKMLGHRRKPEQDIEVGIGQLWEYPHERIVQLGNALCVFMSFLLPSMSTFVLFYVNDMVHRLVLMACFLFMLAALMMFVLECRRVEVFAATAAFAAVQVVFLQGASMTSASC